MTTSDRPLNFFGFSIETVAAEYETDAALAEADLNVGDPYFSAAWSAESEQREIDRAITEGPWPT